MNKEDFEAALNRARNLCAKSEKCADDLYKKNKSWKIPYPELENIIIKLKEEGFIDHQRYAAAFVNDKLKFNHWGRKKIQYTLKAKSIEDEIIENEISNIDEDTYNQILEEELLKKQKKLANQDKTTQKQKIIQYLTQKGFEYGKVFEFIENKFKLY